MSNQQKASLLALLAVFFWSTMSSAFKLSLNHISFEYLLFWSGLFGFILLAIINGFSKHRISRHNTSLKDLLSSASMGLFNPFLYYLILFKAYELLEAQEAGTLNYTWPIALVLLSIILLKQKIKAMSLVAIGISFFGVLIISTRGQVLDLNFSNPRGVGLAIGSSVFWALYWILNMKDKREETGKITLNILFGLLYLLIYLWIQGKGIVWPAKEAWLGIAYIGAFELSITFVIWLRALQLSSDTAKVSNLIFLSPFLALFWIHLAVGESIRMATIIGLAFIIAGIVWQQLLGAKKKA